MCIRDRSDTVPTSETSRPCRWSFASQVGIIKRCASNRRGGTHERKQTHHRAGGGRDHQGRLHPHVLRLHDLAPAIAVVYELIRQKRKGLHLIEVNGGSHSEFLVGGGCVAIWESCWIGHEPVSYTHLRAHETRHDLVCR